MYYDATLQCRWRRFQRGTDTARTRHVIFMQARAAAGRGIAIGVMAMAEVSEARVIHHVGVPESGT